MSRYTLRLSDVCEILYKENDSVLNLNFEDLDLPELNNIFDSATPDEIIAKVRPKIFDFSYPLPNNSEDKKVELETKILKHFYTREIGFDSWGRFKLALNERLNLIMPYFNEIYKSVEFMNDNPLVNNEIRETKNTTNENSNVGSTTVNSNTTAREVTQDTPTSKLGNEDYASKIVENESHANDNTSNTGSSNGKEDMTRVLTGLSNYSKQDMIRRYRENIINVEEAIINELYDLFLLIYN